MKKLCALFLCITMLLSLACVAQATTTLNFVDTFDDLAVGTITSANVTNYAHAFGSWFYPEGASLAITEDGYNGNALTITENDTTKFQIALLNDTAVFAPTADAPVYVSFKVKIKENLDNTAVFQVNNGYDSLFNIMPSGSDYVFAPTNKSGNLICTPNEWYDVQVKFTPGRADVKITDNNGTSVTGYRANASGGYLYMYSSGGSTSPSKAGQSIAFDEISVIQGDGTDTLNFVSSNYGGETAESYNKNLVVNEGFNQSEIKPSTQSPLAVYMIKSGNFYGSINDSGTGANGILMSHERISYTMESDCKGGYAPRITNSGSSYFTSKMATYETGKAFASMRIRMEGTTAGYFGIGNPNDIGYELMIRSGKFETWQYWGRKYSDSYIPEMWYTVVIEYTKVNGANAANLYVYNDQNELFFTATPSGNSLRGVGDAAIYFSFYNTDKPVSIDDVKVIWTDASDSQAFIAKEILGVSASDPKSNVHSTTPVIKASFDQIVSSGSTAKFTAVGKDDVAATIKYTGSPLVEIAPVTPLDYDTNYTLDLSGIKGLNGQGLATGSTNALSIKTPAYSMGTMVVTPVYDGTTATVTVNFTNSNLAKLDATVIGVLTKDNKLEYCSVKTLKEAPLGENTLTFTNLPEDRTGMTFKLLAWDNFTSLKPLFK